jgi:basic amino acid/polyamine antiporter, APA family
VTPLATAAGRFAGSPGHAVMLLAATVSIFGYLTVAILSTPRCLFAFARDGFLPRALAAVHPRYRSPHVAIVVHSLLATALALSGTFERLAILANASILTLYFLCAVAAFVLRRRDVRAGGEPFRSPGGPLVPALTCAAIAWVLTETISLRELTAVGALILVALALYAVRGWRGESPPTALGSSGIP